MALCRSCHRVIPCHCHTVPPVQIRPGVYLAGGTQPGNDTEAPCGCPHPADEHSVYGCVDGCGCEWMPRRSP